MNLPIVVSKPKAIPFPERLGAIKLRKVPDLSACEGCAPIRLTDVFLDIFVPITPRTRKA